MSILYSFFFSLIDNIICCQDPGYGADVLRWWVALSHEESKVLIGKSLLKKYYEQIFKVHSCLKNYLLAVDNTFS